jgi:hypothetical protein
MAVIHMAALAFNQPTAPRTPSPFRREKHDQGDVQLEAGARPLRMK